MSRYETHSGSTVNWVVSVLAAAVLVAGLSYGIAVVYPLVFKV
ncbi:MAG TPA: hypothetical protein VFB13_09530 [Reyranella sp.]|nr:hypothetical protein [Reyranella sp.]